MQLLELIDYGPNTFGTHKGGGGDSENIVENVRLRRKNSPKTPLCGAIAYAIRLFVVRYCLGTASPLLFHSISSPPPLASFPQWGAGRRRGYGGVWEPMRCECDANLATLPCAGGCGL
jgi:hypothetical protein